VLVAKTKLYSIFGHQFFKYVDKNCSFLCQSKRKAGDFPLILTIIYIYSYLVHHISVT